MRRSRAGEEVGSTHHSGASCLALRRTLKGMFGSRPAFISACLWFCPEGLSAWTNHRMSSCSATTSWVTNCRLIQASESVRSACETLVHGASEKGSQAHMLPTRVFRASHQSWGLHADKPKQATVLSAGCRGGVLLHASCLATSGSTENICVYRFDYMNRSLLTNCFPTIPHSTWGSGGAKSAWRQRC